MENKKKSLTSLFNYVLFYAFVFAEHYSLSVCECATPDTQMQPWRCFEYAIAYIPCSAGGLSVFNLVSFEQISFEEMHQFRISHKCHSCVRLLQKWLVFGEIGDAKPFESELYADLYCVG